MKAWCGLALLAAAIPGLARDSTALEQVLGADVAFAAESLERGQQAAFQAWLAADGVVFRPTAVAGREWLGTHEQASGRLEWSPAAGAIGCTGRLAVTTGRWTYSNPESGDTAAGHYLSVWRAGTPGQWQVLLDHGIAHPPHAMAPVALQDAFRSLWPDRTRTTCKPGRRSDGLAEADGDLNAAIHTTGLARALARFAAAGALAYRDEFPPRPLADADWPSDRPFEARSMARTLFVGGEPGSDLGYSHGEITAPSAGAPMPVARAVFVRVWQRDGRRWRLALDMLTPLDAAVEATPPAGAAAIRQAAPSARSVAISASE